jgi:GTP-binding protein Era
MQKFAEVCFIGAPNAGKSTLLNQLLGQKISIVTHKIHTTRDNIRGILSDESTQLVFTDTPGFLQRPKLALEKKIARKALKEIHSVHFVCILIDVSKSDCLQNDLLRHDFYEKLPHPPIVLLNKIDLMPNKEKLLPLLAELQQLNFTNVFMVSASKNKGVADLKKYLLQNAPAGDWQYAEEALTDRSVKVMAEDITREKLYNFLHKEIPYALTVQTESWQETESSVVLHHVILVSRSNQKNIMLGEKGEVMKKVGMQARADIGKMLGKKVHLYLHVKVNEKWLQQLR